MLMADFYKLSHRVMYPEGTEYVYSTWTPRSGKHLGGVNEVVVFGHQAFIKEVLAGIPDREGLQCVSCLDFRRIDSALPLASTLRQLPADS